MRVSLRVDSVLPSKALVCCLVSAVVDELHPAKVAAWNHIEEAYDHVSVSDEIVQRKPSAIEAEWLVHTVLNLALSDSDACHRDPAEQKYIEPDIEDPDHVEIVVLPADTVVEPSAVPLVAIHALVADMAVHCPLRLDDLAVGTNVLRWNLLE